MRKFSMIAAFALVCGLAMPVSFAAAEEAAPAARGPMPGNAVINVFGPAGGALPEGVFAVVANYFGSEKDGYWDGGNREPAAGGNSTTSNMGAVKFRYGLGNGWDIRTMTLFGANDVKLANSANGIGDTYLILRRQWFSQDEGYPVSFGAGLGLQIPTGSTESNGIGTGSWGLMPEIGITYHFDNKRQVIEAGANMLWRSEDQTNDKDIDRQDAYRFHGRYAYALDQNWDLGIETQYEHLTAQKTDGASDANSSTTWFAGPAVTLKIPAWKTQIGASIQLPLYQDYESARGLGEDWRLEMKLTKVF